ncbi:hypothetical protein [Paenibacillus eucommiae]|uniref:FtsH-binding integral membrane protein n=1 Tax=Paenibacillus eucommiae TaxID=1355755 RepID=A0ABS4IRS5_9BACL|nr:hypothetical protein [Paenibacillus eucommiae]MBP1990279.1 FtsH-binding integral membrane protein [Paenibacillus eucommiae]
MTLVYICTLALLAAAHFFLWKMMKSKRAGAGIWSVLLFIILALPVSYAVYDNDRNAYVDANIGLGIAFLFTWAVTVILLVYGIVRRFIR